MTTNRTLSIIVIGAGMTGLSAAILLARDGHRVTVLERDLAPPPPSAEAAWTDWDRPGVNQFRLAHLMLPRWRHEMERELPELLDALLSQGAAQANLLHLQPDWVTHGWQPGDEDLDTITARRPVLEAALACLAEAQPRLTVRRGVRTSGLLLDGRHVCGVDTPTGALRADLVVDAGGRRTSVPEWLRAAGAPTPAVDREDAGFVYYSRHYRARGAGLPRGRGSILTHYPALSLLTLPCDRRTYAVVLVTSSRDRGLRALRTESAWTRLASSLPVAAPWLEGVPLTDVQPLAGLEDVRRRYLRDDRPVVTGLVAIGDASVATNPSLGRGATIGLLDACALRDSLRGGARDAKELVLGFGNAVAASSTPWVELTRQFDRHRLGEMNADIDGRPYVTDDPAWAMTTALLAGAAADPVLARAASRIAGMLATPPEVMSQPSVGSRIGRFLLAARYPADTPTRAAMLETVTIPAA